MNDFDCCGMDPDGMVGPDFFNCRESVGRGAYMEAPDRRIYAGCIEDEGRFIVRATGRNSNA